ncbi:16S rRNA processing protein RimM [Chitinophaga costaii]|uniref:Ribosome maturation factor RimM n=1 Tax=Chitinophaga costaii TaxID=1335309 RepID=A0A1C4F200_9BACT|nr:ribosome maturation factor RimM [Chitinophaga costaii]PUZ22180.1 16S rRNA processing protein RimM [Chitinophaga costaii]SCC49824.1 16S rRNA processing protein RimM [Chitinophaga costaii]
MDNYFSIGRLVATFGLQGELVLKHSLGKRSSLKGITALFLETRKNSFIPYFLEKAKVKDHEQVYVKLEGIDTKEAAQKLTQTNVYLVEADFKAQVSKDAPVSMLGFMVEDEALGEIGIIDEVIEMPLQVLAKVIYQGKELLLPINEASLIEVLQKDKRVRLRLPEGLIDIYL